MPSALTDPELLAAYEARSGSRVGWEYQVKDGVVPLAMDVVADEGDIKTDDKDMSVTYPFASSQDRDRVGDYLEVTGIETANHKRNPQAFMDHAKWFKWSLGLDQNPATKAYTVQIEPNRGLAIATTCIVPIREEHEQVYEFYRRGVLRSGSIGYRTIEESTLPPDHESGLPKGKHLKHVELLETSLVFLPCSQDAVRRMLDEPWGQKSLAAAFRAQLEPHRPRKKPWANGAPLLTIEVRQKAMGSAAKTKTVKGKTKAVKTVESPSPAMSTRDASKGGAMVGPPGEPEETKDDATVETVEEPVSHNVQRMTDVHYVLGALGDIIDADPHLIDHPDIRTYLDKLRPEIEKWRGDTSATLAKSHPDLEPLGGEKDVEVDVEDDEEDDDDDDNPDVVVDDEEVKDDDEEEEKDDAEEEVKDADKTTEEEEKDDDEEEETKSWHARPPRRKSLVARNKSGVRRSGAKALNASQKMCMKDVQTHLEAASQHADVPEPWKSAHAYHATKVADMLDTGGKGEMAPEGDEEESPMDDAKAFDLIREFKAGEDQKFAAISQHILALNKGA